MRQNKPLASSAEHNKTDMLHTGRNLLIFLVTILILLAAPPPASGELAQDTLSTKEKLLLDGKTLVSLERNDDDVVDISGSIFIRSAPESIWAIITDYDNLPETMPNVKESRVVEENGANKIVEQTSKTGVLFFKIKFSTTVAVTEVFPDTLAFSLISGDFHIFNGKWVLMPDRKKSGTFLSWSAVVKPDFRAPEFIIDAVQKRDLRELLETIRELSESGEPATVSEQEEQETEVSASTS